ncbi:MAG TPA: hypothetical protein PKD54_09155 [Pirellulaceae bacterium]|nr:hypothetical protein [Pirellulaceae bacterium]
MGTDTLESQVLSSLIELRNKYRSMNCLTERMLSDELSAGIPDHLTAEMTSELKAIEQIERESLDVRERYRSSRDAASDSVRQATDELALLMQQLLMKISILEHQAAARRESLLPQLQAGAKAVLMQNAYGKHNNMVHNET